MAQEFEELDRGSTSDARLSFTPQDGRCTYVYGIATDVATGISKVGNAIVDMIGGVDLRTQGQQANIKRLLPRRHPFSEDAFITSVNEIKGVGKFRDQTSRPDQYGRPVVEGYALHDYFEIPVEYSIPQYSILLDSEIKTFRTAYTNKDGVDVAIEYANEWLRYVERVETPMGEALTGKYGMLVFETESGDPPGGPIVGGAAAFTNQPYQILPDYHVKMLWRMVPSRYWTSPYSYLRNLPQGVINQFAWFEPEKDADKLYPAGTLRWAGATVKQWVPPIRSANGILVGLDSRRLLDVELNFHYTTRDRFSSDIPTRVQPNKNWLAKGWNLQPNLPYPNQYFYVHTYKGTEAQGGADIENKNFWRPIHNSFPFELLFTDPDYDQPDRDLMVEVRAL